MTAHRRAGTSGGAPGRARAPRTGRTRGAVVILILGLLLLGGPYPTSADLAAGIRAKSRGDLTGAAWEWLLSALRGNAEAQFRLAVAFHLGQGVERDLGRAAEWYRRAAEQGHAGAQFNLGLMLDLGRGLPRDPAAAAAWYQRAAEQGHADAQHNLGVLYRNGRGVERDLAEAVRWYLRAARQGHAPAQVKVALMHEGGEGVAVDLVEAYRWYTLALAGLHGPEREDVLLLQRVLGRRLGPAQLAEARRRVAEWVERPEVDVRGATVWPRAMASAARTGRPDGRARVPEIRAGTGFVVDRAGHLLTGSELVSACGEIRVAGRAASVVARDTETDLALLRAAPGAEPAVFPPAAAGPAADRSVGARVVAAAGPVDATVVPLEMPGEAARYLQVSPAIPARWGGAPLLDDRGRVLGVLVGDAEAARLGRVADAAPGAASFAVAAEAARSFLEAHGVILEGAAGRPPEPRDARAPAFLVAVDCRP